VFLFVFYWGTLPVYFYYTFPHGNLNWGPKLGVEAQKMNAFSVAMGAIGVLSDVYILVLPLPILFSLNLETNKKLALSGIFLTGTM
jgi:hypothetical protein